MSPICIFVSILLLCAITCLCVARIFTGKVRWLSLCVAFIAFAGALAVADTPVYTPGAASLSIQTGSMVCVGSGTITQIFNPVFSAVPSVSITPVGTAALTNYLSSLTATQMVWVSGSLATGYWTAVGLR